MIKFKQSDYVDIDKYEERIRHNGYISCDMNRMSDIYYFNSTKATSLMSLARDTMLFHSDNYFSQIDRDSIYRYLTKHEACPEHYFRKKGVQGISIDIKKVLNKLYQNGYATEFLGYYIESRSLSAKCSKIKTLMTECHESAGNDYKGDPLIRIPYNVNQQQNLRYNYKNYDVIGIPREYMTTIGVEDGYVLAWGDFAQSDFRIAFNLLLRDESNTKFMSDIDDKYEGLARLIAKKNNTRFNKDEFLSMRNTYKTNTLATIYGTRSSVVKEDKDFITMFSEYLSTCPKYTEFEKRINDRIELGLPFTIQSYFGHEEWIPILPNTNESMFKALNTPIQSGTSEVVILLVNYILDKFYSLGYTEDDISIYMVRHDEPLFKMKEHVLKDAWIFKEVSKIFVDNWIPLEIKFSFGHYYKCPDDEYTRLAEQSYRDNKDKITIIQSSQQVFTEYYPLKPVYKMCVVYKQFHDKTCIIFYDFERKLYDVRFIKSIDEKVIYDYIKLILQSVDDLTCDEYKGIVIYNNIYKCEVLLNDRTYTKFIPCTNSHTGTGCMMLDYFIRLYEENSSLEYTVPPIKDEVREYVQTFKRVQFKKDK